MTLRPRTALGPVVPVPAGSAPPAGRWVVWSPGRIAALGAELSRAHAAGKRVAVVGPGAGAAILPDPPAVWYDETADFEPDAFREMAGRIRQ